MASTSTNTSRTATKKGESQPPLMLPNGIAPDYDSMRRAADVLKVAVSVGEGDGPARELLGALRIEVKKRLKPVPKDQQLVCQKCGERSTDDTDFCPFCGDSGIAPDDAPAQVVEGTGISQAATAEPVSDVDGKLSDLAGELNDRLGKLSQLKLNTLDCSFDMGVIVKEIHDRQLYKAKGYSNFKQFAEKELPFTRQTAYQLVQLVERYDKKTFLEVGFRKLKTINGVNDGELRDQMLDDAKSGASARDIDQRASSTRPARASTPPSGSKKSSAPPLENGHVTVLAKIDGKPRDLRFKSTKGGALNSAGKVTMVVADAYAEVEVAADVFLRIGLRIEGKDLVGLSAEFVRPQGAA